VPQWSPSLADGTTGVDRDQRGVGSLAAMEPVLGGRDDRPGQEPRRRRCGCRNGARPWRTGRLERGWLKFRVRDGPQWSPSLADGTTIMTEPGTVTITLAAMEPVLGGRDDPALSTLPGASCSPQWSPSLADGTTVGVGADGGFHVLAAMEPVLGGRDDGRRRVQIDEAEHAAMEPVLGGRDDLELGKSFARSSDAAMEPVLGGRDDASRLGLFPPSAPGRNGARPWRTGRQSCSLTASPLLFCRNGARPWRTGRPAGCSGRSRFSGCRNGARPWRTGRLTA